jgi:hypothetical protein
VLEPRLLVNYVHCLKPEEYKLYTFFHVFCLYSVLLSTDSTYSRVPGDEGGLIFFKRDFFWWSFYVQIGLLHFRFKIVSEHVQIYKKLYVTNMYVTNLY